MNNESIKKSGFVRSQAAASSVDVLNSQGRIPPQAVDLDDLFAGQSRWAAAIRHRAVEKIPGFDTISNPGIELAYLPLVDTMHHVLKAWCIII